MIVIACNRRPSCELDRNNTNLVLLYPDGTPTTA
jgi:hypothetical protein